jgi:hypothetical protein
MIVVSVNSNTTGVTSGAETAYPSNHQNSSRFCEARAAQSSIF